MSATTEKSDATGIRRFHVEIPEETLDDLRRRIAAGRWASRELVDDRSPFLGEIFRAPRSWVEQADPTLSYFNEADKGGHFAAW
jgi:hypothetical protein